MGILFINYLCSAIIYLVVIVIIRLIDRLLKLNGFTFMPLTLKLDIRTWA